MQIFKTKKFNKGWNGFTADEMTNRLKKVLVGVEDAQGYGEFLKRKNTSEEKPSTLTTQEWENYQKIKEYERRNPLSGAKADDKFAVIQKEYKEALKLDLEARKVRSEAIERSTQNQLKAMGLEPEKYIYSRELVHDEEGSDED